MKTDVIRDAIERYDRLRAQYRDAEPKLALADLAVLESVAADAIEILEDLYAAWAADPEAPVGLAAQRIGELLARVYPERATAIFRRGAGLP